MIVEAKKRQGAIDRRFPKLLSILECAKLAVKNDFFQKRKAWAEGGKKFLFIDFDGRDFYEEKKIPAIKNMGNERESVGRACLEDVT